MYYHYKALHQAVRTKKPGDNQKARALWAMKAAKERELQFYDPTHQERHSIKTSNTDKLADLAKASECLEAAFGCFNVGFIGRCVEAYSILPNKRRATHAFLAIATEFRVATVARTFLVVGWPLSVVPRRVRSATGPPVKSISRRPSGSRR